MPINQIRSSPRAKGAIAGVMLSATLIGGVWYTQSGEPAAIVLARETLIQPWEGRKLHAYLDRIAKPPVWTVCDGDTDHVYANTVETPAGCDKRISVKLYRDYYGPLKKCIPDFDKRPVAWQAMMLSLSWNIGVGSAGGRGACGSTAARLGIKGEYESSCLAATQFNKAGGRVIIGIVKRREMGDTSRIGEAELCVTGS